MYNQNGAITEATATVSEKMTSNMTSDKLGEDLFAMVVFFEDIDEYLAFCRKLIEYFENLIFHGPQKHWSDQYNTNLLN